MATEIELKAHVRDIETLRRLLAEKAEYLYSFEKEDCYWFPSGEPRPDIPPPPLYRSGLRIRSEKRVFPDGRAESSCAATCKAKKVRNGIEINDEKEFTVEPRAAFEGFLALAGFKSGAVKKKRGWAYSSGGINKPSARITAELLEVPGLGWFLELEIVIDDDTAAGGRADDDTAVTAAAGGTSANGGIGGAEEEIFAGDRAENGIIPRSAEEEIFAGAEKRLLDFLRALDIPEEDIESRFYSEMLKERDFGKAPL